MSGNESGKGSRSTQPATVPGAVSVPANEEPGERRARPPAPPRHDSPPPSSRELSKKSRRTAAPATLPGAVAVDFAVEEPGADGSSTRMLPHSGGSRSSHRSRKSRATAPAVTPGAVAISAEEPPTSEAPLSPTLSPMSNTSNTSRGSRESRSKMAPATSPGAVALTAQEPSDAHLSPASSTRLHGKPHRAMAPATVPGAVAVDTTEEPSEAHLSPDSSTRSDGKSHRTMTSGTVPGAVAVDTTEEPSDAPLSPLSSTRSDGKSHRTTAPATVPGAVAVNTTEEPDGGGGGGTKAMRSSASKSMSLSKSSSLKKSRRSAPSTTPGAVHVAVAANQGKETRIEEDQVEMYGGMNAMATLVYEEDGETQDVVRDELSNLESDIETKAIAGAHRGSSVPGAVAVDGLVALRSADDDAIAKKIAADGSGPTMPGAQAVLPSEQQDASAMRKDPRARHGGRRNREKKSGAMADTTVSATTSPETENSPSFERGDYRREVQDRLKEMEQNLLSEKRSASRQLNGEKDPGFEDFLDEDKAPFDPEADPAFGDFNNFDQRENGQTSPLIASAARGTVGAPDLQHGTVDEFHAGPGLLGARDDDLAIAVAVEADSHNDYMHLPQGIEYDPDAKPPILKNVRFRFYAMSIVLIFITIIIAVVLAVVIFKPDPPSRETYAPTEIPSNPPSSTIDGEYRKAVAIKVGDSVFVPETPQDRAARWIIEEDPRKLALDDELLIQRYLLALFYFDTTDGGKNPWRSCNPPTPGTNETDACGFLKFVRNDDDSISYTPEASVRWLSEAHECEWAGNLCDDTNVTRAIDLIGQNISGTLPTELALFDVLQSISLAYNDFTGTLPTEYAGMRHLLNLEVHGNNLGGTIPDDYFQATSLQNLNVGDNYFTGTLSTEIGTLTNLKGFQSFENLLTGTFPSEISKLRFLSFSRNDENAFSGNIPTEFGDLSLMQELWLSRNQFTGRLPSELGRLTELMDLRCYQNKLSGSIPAEYYNLTLLFRLDLFGMFLTGTLSTEIGLLTKMEQLRVSRNYLTGSIPTEVALLNSLDLAWFHANQMAGSLPTEICSLRPRPLLFLQTDCFPEGAEPNPCACCTACCNRDTEICQVLDDNA